MTNKRVLLGAMWLMVFPVVTFAQNVTNSPYTRYGLGQLSDQTSAMSRGLGGSAYALRDSKFVNFANPASYSGVDSLTMKFDLGMSLQNSNFSDDDNVSLNAKNSSLDYLMLNFRLAPHLGIAAGIMPFASVGYDFDASSESTDEEASNINYSGSDGFSQAFVGLGYDVLPNLSVGMNASYLFGTTTKNQTQLFPNSDTAYPTVISRSVRIKSYKLDFGLQYQMHYSKDLSAIIGATYSPGVSVNNTSYISKSTYTTSGTVDTSYRYDLSSPIDYASHYGLGATLMWKNWLFTADATYEDWGGCSYPLVNLGDLPNESTDNIDAANYNTYSDRYRLSVGTQYQPNPNGRSLWSVTRYSIGGYIDALQYSYDNQRAAYEYGVSVGLAMPVFRSNSILSISGQYSILKPQVTGLLEENRFKISIGLTFNERWFFKRKIQ
ncbi:MAG: hypothetical protein WCR36_00035 [Bacteroidaceae bacterium]